MADGDDMTSPLQDYKNYMYLRHVSHWKLFVFKERRSQDLRMRVLLNNADCYIKSVTELQSQAYQELGPQPMLPNEMPLGETGWVLQPGSSYQENPGAHLEEAVEASPSTMGNSQQNISIYAASESSSCYQEQAGSTLPEDLLDLLPTTGEGPLQDLCRGPDLGVDGSIPCAEGNTPSSASEALAPNPGEEDNIWDVLSQDDLICNSLSGSFEILAENYLPNFAMDDFFFDIDTSAFHGTQAPSNEHSLPASTCRAVGEGLPVEAAQVPDQNFNSLEHFVEHLSSSE